MANTEVFMLSREDRDELIQLLREYQRSRRISTLISKGSRVEQDLPSPPTLIGYAAGGISARQDTIPGEAECDMYRVLYSGDNPVLTPMGFSQRVVNISDEEVDRGSFVVATQDRIGTWLVTAVSGVVDVGTGTGSGIGVGEAPLCGSGTVEYHAKWTPTENCLGNSNTYEDADVETWYGTGVIADDRFTVINTPAWVKQTTAPASGNLAPAVLKLITETTDAPTVGVGVTLEFLASSPTTGTHRAQAYLITRWESFAPDHTTLIIGPARNGSPRPAITMTSIGTSDVGIGFLGAGAIARQTITGSRGGNAALANLLTALALFGLITDSTTA